MATDLTNTPATQWRVVDRVDRSFDVRIRDGLLADGGTDLLYGGRVPGRRFVVLDGGLATALAGEVRRCLGRHGVTAQYSVLTGGRRACSIDAVDRLATQLREFGLDRRTEPVLVIGGRSVTNVGCFVAGIYRRGVPFVCVPTTPLAVFVATGLEPELYRSGVDDLTGRAGWPIRVVVDRGFFGTLPIGSARAGAAETLRVAVGHDAALFDDLERAADGLPGRLADEDVFGLFRRAVEGQIGRQGGGVPAGDLASGLGRAVMRASHGRVPVGTSVAVGVAAAARLAVARGCLAEADGDRIIAVIERMGLPVTAPPETTPGLAGAASAVCTGAEALLPGGIGRLVTVDGIGPEEIGRALMAGRAHARLRTPQRRDQP